jgi:hypothetical protein
MTRAIAVALTLVATTSVAEAQTTDTGVTLGARLAYGIPFGYAQKLLTLHDYASGSIPVVVEAGYRFTKELSASAYFQYAYATGSSSICEAIPPASRTSGSTCSSASGRVLRYGVEGAFRFPVQGMTPWVGLGFGGESARSTTTVHIPASPSISQAFNGDVDVGRSTNVIGEVNVQGGVEWPIARRLSIGPFATVTLARYTQASFSPNPWGLSDSVASSDQTWHGWLFLGAKGTFDL